MSRTVSAAPPSGPEAPSPDAPRFLGASLLSPLTVAALLVVSTLAWWWLHRFWFLSGDDYLFIADPHSSRGAFSARYWWEALQDDWLRRNGRLADGVLRLVLRPGQWFYPIFGPIMLTAAGAMIAITARVAARLPTTPLWMWVTGLGIIPVTCWLVPGMTGDVIFWTAAAINYVLPMAMLLGTICLYLALLDGRRIPWPAMAAGAVLVALTDALQEVTSGSMLLVALAVIVIRRGRLDARLWLLTGAALVAFVVHMAAPGLWARSDLVVSNANHGFLESTLRGVATSATLLWVRTSFLWIALIALLAVHGLSPRHSPGRRLTLLGAGGASALFALLCAFYVHRVDPSVDPSLTLVLPVTFATMLAFLLVGCAFLVAPATFGQGALLVWVGLVGSCVFVFASGATGARVHFIPIAMMLLVLTILLAPLLERLSPAQSLVIALAMVVLPAATWFDETRLATATNSRFVAAEIVAPLEAASRHEVDAVILPDTLPRPPFAYRAAFMLERYETALRIYYAVPDDVTITNG